MRGNKIVNAIIAFVIVGVLAVGVCCLGFASRGNDGKWFGGFKDLSSWHWSDGSSENKPDIPDTPDNPDTPDTPDKPDESYGGNVAGGAIITDGENNGISLLSAEIPAEDYEEYGINTLAETAYTLTATIDTNDDVLSQLEWNIEFVNPSSSWASGKNLSSYVTMSVSSDTHSATLSCAQAFGEQIKVTVKAKWYPEVKAVCTVDYIKRLTGVTAVVGTSGQFSGKYIMNTTVANVINTTPTYGVGTVQGVFTAGNSITISIGSKLKSYLTNYISSLGVSSQFSIKDSFSIGLSEKLTLDHFMTRTQNPAYGAQYKLICNELCDCVSYQGSNAVKGDWKFTISYTYVHGSFSQNGTSTATAIEFYMNGITKYQAAHTVTVTPNVAF